MKGLWQQLENGERVYHIDYFDPTGKRARKSFKKKKDAKAEFGKHTSLIAEGRYLNVKKEYNTNLKELIDKYVEIFQHPARNIILNTSGGILESKAFYKISGLWTLRQTETT